MAFMLGSWPLSLASLAGLFLGLFMGPLFLVAELSLVPGMPREVQAGMHERLLGTPTSRVSRQARVNSS